MIRGRRRILAGLAGALALLWLYPDAEAAERRGVSCGKEHNMRITDLDMSPDPIERGKRVKQWRVTLEVDGTGECETMIEVREKPDRELVARTTKATLKPGRNEIRLDPEAKYAFREKEHCLEVQVHIEKTRKAIDEREGFCAREIGDGRYTMKERGDRPIKRNP
jgi:hypothetical protein